MAGIVRGIEPQRLPALVIREAPVIRDRFALLTNRQISMRSSSQGEYSEPTGGPEDPPARSARCRDWRCVGFNQYVEGSTENSATLRSATRVSTEVGTQNFVNGKKVPVVLRQNQSNLRKQDHRCEKTISS